MRQTSLSNDIYSKKWVHADEEKPHSYYAKTFIDKLNSTDGFVKTSDYAS